VRSGALWIAVAAAGFVAFVAYSLKTVEPIEVVQSHLYRRGGQVFVQGTLTNTGAESASVDVEVRYFDRDGRQLAVDTVVIKGLKAGQTVQFKSPPEQLAGASTYSLYLNHRRNPYGN